MTISLSLSNARTALLSTVSYKSSWAAVEVELAVDRLFHTMALTTSLITFRSQVDLSQWQRWSDRSFSIIQQPLVDFLGYGCEGIGRFTGLVVNITAIAILSGVADAAGVLAGKFYPGLLVETSEAVDLQDPTPVVIDEEEPISEVFAAVLEMMTVRDLKAVAKASGLKGYSNHRKAQLVEMMAASEAAMIEVAKR